jgi:Protein of unknown function (DUF3592)
MSAERLFDLIATKAMGVFFASCGGVLLVQFPSYYVTEVAFEANKVSATGTVVATSEKQEYFGGVIAVVSSRTIYISKVEFQTLQGKSVEFITSSACSSRQDCDRKTVRVQYDPSVPSQARIDSLAPLNIRIWLYVVFFIIFLSIGIGLLVVDPGNRPTQSND